MRSSTEERRDLLKAWAATTAVFTLASAGGLSLLLSPGALFSLNFLEALVISAVAVGAGFLLHELAHKHVAQRYGCWAEFRSFDQMLGIAVVFALFGFVFLAPGAVMISGRVTPGRNGRISAAGPLMNIVLAVAFGLLAVVPVPFVQKLGLFGAGINAWLGLFNLLPFFGLDGSKVLAWNKGIYAALVLVSLALVFTSPWHLLA
jgi:Zn-dependent protease